MKTERGDTFSISISARISWLGIMACIAHLRYVRSMTSVAACPRQVGRSQGMEDMMGLRVRTLMTLAFIALSAGVFAVGSSNPARSQEAGKTMTTPTGLQITDTKI